MKTFESSASASSSEKCLAGILCSERLDRGTGKNEYKKIYEIEFFINFYGSLNVVDGSMMNNGANGVGTCRRMS